MKLLLHTLLIIASFLTIFIIEQTQLADYQIQIIIILIITYFFLSYISKKNTSQKPRFGGSSDIFILTVVVLLLVIATGSLYSPIFFLIYFLAFGIAFIFEPVAVFIFTFGAICLFMSEVLKNHAIESFIRIGSIILISPLAYFFGQQYRVVFQKTKTDQKKEKIASLIKADVKDILKTQEKLKGKTTLKLNDILEELDQLEKK